MKPKTFEDYLQEFHGEIYHGTDDDMPDAFDAWLVELDADSWIALGDRVVHEAYLAGLQRGGDIAVSAIDGRGIPAND